MLYHDTATPGGQNIHELQNHPLEEFISPLKCIEEPGALRCRIEFLIMLVGWRGGFGTGGGGHKSSLACLKICGEKMQNRFDPNP
jgi:hypothetical protein